MFDKLKKMFKSKDKKADYDSSRNRKEYTEKLNWGILPDNPSKISMFQSSSGKNPNIVVADFLYDLLTEKGREVHIINDEEGMKWLYVPKNGYYLLPLLNFIISDFFHVSAYFLRFSSASGYSSPLILQSAFKSPLGSFKANNLIA